MSALRVARGFTKRDVIVKFDGAYHGHSDSLLVKAGSGAATFGNPDSAGVPASIVSHTATLGYNDIPALRELFARRGGDIAAVIVEPVAGNMGCVPPAPGFLEAIVELCRAHGALSVFDEVMTGSRLSQGGAQRLYGLVPDLTCLGKVVGGGMPLAVYGGRRDAMSLVAPLGPIYQAGTLSGNPLAVSAGLATLELLTKDSYEKLEATSEKLAAGLSRALRETGTTGVVQRVGSMLTLFFHDGPVNGWNDAKTADTRRFASFHRGLSERGVYWPPSQFEAAFVSLAHSESDIDVTLSAARAALEQARA
jgi:glutamate-1-semialdehyde 2,1-aminomutase